MNVLNDLKQRNVLKSNNGYSQGLCSDGGPGGIDPDNAELTVRAYFNFTEEMKQLAENPLQRLVKTLALELPNEPYNLVPDVAGYREGLLKLASRHMVQMREYLGSMNLHPQKAINDVTVLAIVEAIVATELRDVVAWPLDRYGKADVEMIGPSLGNWSTEQ